jgi:N-methylhydantoinase B/oxoprolinase/acetone carboxylase alpha subunit
MTVIREPLADVDTPGGADPTRLEVFRHYLTGAAEEVWRTIRRTAYSLTIKERGDCSGAIFDFQGDMLAIPQNGVPLHQGSLEALVREVLAKSGALASFVVNAGTPGEATLPAVVTNHPLQPGDVVTCLTPGGGGFGPPAERDPRLVEHDLCDGRITPPFADEWYRAE